jgi:hypothetical protein
MVRRVLAARSGLSEEAARRLERMQAVFAGPPTARGREKAA